MTTAKRKKRPALDRTKPVRSWSTALGAPAAEPGDGATRPKLEDAISRSVELGYRVVDDYIQQGQRAAQRMSEGKLTAETVASEAQELSARIARYASDFFGAWVELLDLAAAGSAARQGVTTPTGSPTPSQRRRHPHLRPIAVRRRERACAWRSTPHDPWKWRSTSAPNA